MERKNNLNNNNNTSNNTFFVLIALCCFPFIQLGISYYLSIQILAFILILHLISLRILVKSAPVLSILFCLMLLSLFSLSSFENVAHAVLKVGREFICYSALFCMLKYRQIICENNTLNSSIKVMIATLTIGLFFLVIAQYFFLQKGIALILPEQLYTRNANTLPGQLDLRFSHVRPAGPFGEPSYLGFVSISILVCVLNIFNPSFLKKILIMIILSTIALSETASGEIVAVVLLFIYFFKSIKNNTYKIAFIVLCVVTISSGFYLNLSTFDRINNISDRKKESSGYVRLITPAIVASSVILNHPLGIPNEELVNLVINTKEISQKELFGSLSNGFYNILINYGLVGIALLILLFIPISTQPFFIAYIFLSTMFNGAFLSFDKIAIIVCTMYIVFIFKKPDNIEQKRFNHETL